MSKNTHTVAVQELSTDQINQMVARDEGRATRATKGSSGQDRPVDRFTRMSREQLLTEAQALGIDAEAIVAKAAAIAEEKGRRFNGGSVLANTVRLAAETREQRDQFRLLTIVNTRTGFKVERIVKKSFLPADVSLRDRFKAHLIADVGTRTEDGFMETADDIVWTVSKPQPQEPKVFAEFRPVGSNLSTKTEIKKIKGKTVFKLDDNDERIPLMKEDGTQAVNSHGKLQWEVERIPSAKARYEMGKAEIEAGWTSDFDPEATGRGSWEQDAYGRTEWAWHPVEGATLLGR